MALGSLIKSNKKSPVLSEDNSTYYLMSRRISRAFSFLQATEVKKTTEPKRATKLEKTKTEERATPDEKTTKFERANGSEKPRSSERVTPLEKTKKNERAILARFQPPLRAGFILRENNRRSGHMMSIKKLEEEKGD